MMPCNLLLGRLDQIETLFAFSSSKPIDQWTEAEQKIAGDISGAFHLVGVLAEEGLLPSKLLGQIFDYSIPRARKSLHPYLVSIRSERGASYWGGFDLLFRRALECGAFFDPLDPRLIKTLDRS